MRGVRLAAIVGLVLLAAATAQGQEPQKLRLVEIVVSETRHRLEAVTVTVQNVTDSPQNGYVWYILSEPGNPQPWVAPAYMAPEQAFEGLGPGQAVSLSFAGPDVQLTGQYGLSVWVHQLNASGEREHADGAAYGEVIVLEPPLFLAFDHLDVITQSPALAPGESLVFATLTIRNNTELMMDLGYSLSISPPDDQTNWERAVFVRPFQFLILKPGQSITVTTRDAVALPDGVFGVHGWLHRMVDGQQQHETVVTHAAPLVVSGGIPEGACLCR